MYLLKIILFCISLLLIFTLLDSTTHILLGIWLEKKSASHGIFETPGLFQMLGFFQQF